MLLFLKRTSDHKPVGGYENLSENYVSFTIYEQFVVYGFLFVRQILKGFSQVLWVFYDLLKCF